MFRIARPTWRPVAPTAAATSALSTKERVVCIELTLARHSLAVGAERVHERIDVGFRVLDRDRPLLFLAGGLEDATVQEPVPGGVEEGVVDRRVIAVPLD